jgi:hypothetical protein
MSKFDRNKTYTWEAADKFEMTGEEFGIITNSIQLILNTEEARKILVANEANKVLDNIVARAVEADIAKEIEQSK